MDNEKWIGAAVIHENALPSLDQGLLNWKTGNHSSIEYDE